MTTRLLGGILAGILTLALAHSPSSIAADSNIDLPSLMTSTPAEGYALAIRLSRLGVVQTQPDKSVLKEQRPEYSKDPTSLIAASQVIAIHFQTIAAANDYWKESE
jgi:hypothetical protein